MNQVTTTRNYALSQPTLIQVGNLMVENMYRDQVEFAKHGVKPERFTALKQLIEELAKLPDDHVLSEELYDLQNRANIARNKIVQFLDELAITVELAFGKNSVEYAKFNFESYSNKRKADLVFKQVEKVCTLISTDPMYTDLEFSPETIAQIRDLATILFDLRVKIQNFGTYRKSTTVLRVEKANAVYRELSALCSAGKRIWLSRNKVYYDNYVLQKSVRRRSSSNPAAA